MTSPQPQYGTTNPYPPQPIDGAPTGRATPPGPELSDKSKITGGLLGILLGGFGVGRFYLGYTGLAIAQILVTWLTLGIGGIWPFIDGILIITGKVPDKQGRRLRD